MLTQSPIWQLVDCRSGCKTIHRAAANTNSALVRCFSTLLICLMLQQLMCNLLGGNRFDFCHQWDTQLLHLCTCSTNSSMFVCSLSAVVSNRLPSDLQCGQGLHRGACFTCDFSAPCPATSLMPGLPTATNLSSFTWVPGTYNLATMPQRSDDALTHIAHVQTAIICV